MPQAVTSRRVTATSSSPAHLSLEDGVELGQRLHHRRPRGVQARDAPMASPAEFTAGYRIFTAPVQRDALKRNINARKLLRPDLLAGNSHCSTLTWAQSGTDPTAPRRSLPSHRGGSAAHTGSGGGGGRGHRGCGGEAAGLGSNRRPRR